MLQVLQEQLAESKASIVDFEMEHAKRIDELTVVLHTMWPVCFCVGGSCVYPAHSNRRDSIV